MTFSAAHILMRAFKGKRGLLVIKESGTPFDAIVAIDAVSSLLSSKLLAVWILMTVLTYRGSPLEVHVTKVQLQIWGLMTTFALDGLMRP
jgi:hypothetical protein